jgi:mandelate racemase
MSSHLFPEVSAHLLAATPGCHWLEFVDWAEPILSRPMEVKNGMAMPLDGPGTGMTWDEKAVERYAA